MPLAALPIPSRTLCILLAGLTIASTAGATQRPQPPEELAHLDAVVLSVSVYPELGGMADEKILEREAALEIEGRGIRVETAAELRARGLEVYQSTRPTLWITVSSTFEPGENMPGTLKVDLRLDEMGRLRRGRSRRWGPPVGLSTDRRNQIVPVASKGVACQVALDWVKNLARRFANDVVEATDHDYFYNRSRLAGWWHGRAHDRRHQPISRDKSLDGEPAAAAAPSPSPESLGAVVATTPQPCGSPSVAPLAPPEPPFPISEDVPEVVAYAAPQYHEAGRRARVEGTVLIEVLIGPEGSVVHRNIAKDLPMGLGKMAFEAAKAWRFRPSEAERRTATLEFVFVLDSDTQALPRFRFEGPFRMITWAPTPVVASSNVY